jgi:thiamine-phosphate pyrophosphorylase
MRRCYSGIFMANAPAYLRSCRRTCLPRIWLLSDARNDAVLEAVLRRLPRGSGLIYRHYHLTPAERRARFARLARVARQRGHGVALAGSAREARAWGANAVYGDTRLLAPGPALPRLVTAHSLRELARTSRARAAAVLLSPVFPTRSHPGASTLGPLRFRLLAARSTVPVIALGGLTARQAARLGVHSWAAIDGLCEPKKR